MYISASHFRLDKAVDKSLSLSLFFTPLSFSLSPSSSLLSLSLFFTPLSHSLHLSPLFLSLPEQSRQDGERERERERTSLSCEIIPQKWLLWPYNASHPNNLIHYQ
ncbi:unnamed protein product [Lota lota]